MYSLTLTTLLALALSSFTTATPTVASEARQCQAQITFYGAAGVSYSLSAPTDATLFSIGEFF
jgi:hypothetical protein